MSNNLIFSFQMLLETSRFQHTKSLKIPYTNTVTFVLTCMIKTEKFNLKTLFLNELKI